MKKLNLSLLIFLVSISMVILSCSQEVHTHTYSTEWTSDESVHWHAATCGCKDLKVEKFVHTFGDWTTTQEPTEEAEGSKERTCTVCSYKATEVIEKLAHTHKFADSWTSDDIYHWHACSCGDKQDEAEHSFVWQVTTEPTESSSGTNERICSICNYSVEEITLEAAPEGFVFVQGGTIEGKLPFWNPQYDCCKGVFIEGRTVTLSDFYMGKYEVTRDEYASVMKGQTVTVDGLEYTLFNGGDIGGKVPIRHISWYDAVWYCNALSEKERLIPTYDIVVITVNSEGIITKANVSLNNKELRQVIDGGSVRENLVGCILSESIFVNGENADGVWNDRTKEYVLTVPEFGFKSPQIIFSNVDFPEPFLPVKRNRVLPYIVKLKSLNIILSPYAKYRPDMFINSLL